MANRSAFATIITASRLLIMTVLALGLLLLAVLPRSALAVESDWIEFENSSLRIISAVDSLGPSSDVMLGLQFKLRPNWKVYWRTAGDAGYPPSLDWEGSSGIETMAIQWPAPTRFAILGIESAGYKKAVVLPVLLKRSSPDAPVKLQVNVNFLVCAEICIPRNVDIALNIPAGSFKPSDQAHLIDTYRGKIPVRINREISPVSDSMFFAAPEGVSLQVKIKSERRPAKLEMFVEGEDFPWFWQPQISYNAQTGLTTVTTNAPDGEIADFSDVPVTLTMISDGEIFETVIKPVIGVAPAQPQGQPLLFILLLAFLGGVILNLMPCVLPVLSIKLMSVLEQKDEQRSVIRRNFVASAAGVISAFLVLAAGLSALKLAGASLGWGIQFQQPVFLVFMTVIIVGFAANMLGFFEISLPSRWSTAMTVGSGGSSLRAHFLTGAFATLLATPCSAPFLGTAVSYALSRSYGDIFAVFIFLGLGLALPYLLIATFPGAVRFLPKPGKWMNGLKIFLALALIATAIWLLTILWVQIGTLPTLGITVIMAVILLLLRISSGSMKALQMPAVLVLTALALGISAFSGYVGGAVSVASSSEDTIAWGKFSKQELARQIADGKTVFVDITADWCLTCKFNKAAVLDRAETVAMFKKRKIVALKGDWTKPDPAISAFLAENGRYGIPFNAVYSAKSPEGKILPELLTRDSVFEAIGAK